MNGITQGSFITKMRNNTDKKILKNICLCQDSMLSRTRRFYHILRLMLQNKKIHRQWKECHAEVRKSYEEVKKEINCLIWNYGCSHKGLIHDYFSSGLFRKGTCVDDFCMSREYAEVIRKLQEKHKDFIRRISDKDTCKQLLATAGVPVTSTLGLIRSDRGKIHFTPQAGCAESDFPSLLRKQGILFCKPGDEFATQGKGCVKVYYSDSAYCTVNGTHLTENAFAELTGERGLLVEPCLKNHPTTAAFHPASLNTLRIQTMLTPNDGAEVHHAVFRMGRGGMTVDNLHSGGIAIGVQPDGCLSKEGYSDYPQDPTFREHPDTEIPFSGTKLPFYEECTRLATETHLKLFPNLFNIGWDFAITESGPVVVEVNVKLPCMFQAQCGGIRRVLETWLRPLSLIS